MRHLFWGSFCGSRRLLESLSLTDLLALAGCKLILLKGPKLSRSTQQPAAAGALIVLTVQDQL